MKKEDRTLKNLIEISIIIFSISIILFGICFSAFMTGIDNLLILAGIFISSEILMCLSGIAIFVATIIMIVKICTDNTVQTGEKVLWAILVYLVNAFVLPFAFNKFVLKTADNKGAIKLVIFEGISFGVMLIGFIVFFVQMISLINF